MFICTELIEETGRAPGLIFGLARTSSSLGTKGRVEANNNRFAVVVCPRHVVKRPSKRSALVTNIFCSIIY